MSRRVLAGSGPTAFFDMPFMPIFFTVAFLMHPVFGWLIVVGGVVIVVLSVMTEMRTRRPTMSATVSSRGPSRHRRMPASEMPRRSRPWA